MQFGPKRPGEKANPSINKQVLGIVVSVERLKGALAWSEASKITFPKEQWNTRTEDKDRVGEDRGLGGTGSVYVKAASRKLTMIHRSPDAQDDRFLFLVTI